MLLFTKHGNTYKELALLHDDESKIVIDCAGACLPQEEIPPVNLNRKLLLI